VSRVGIVAPMIGNKYGKLTVVSFHHQKGEGPYYYLCQCECGNTHIASGSNLRYGRTKSCGCLHPGTGHESIKYGTLYHTWIAMRRRCYDKNNGGYPWYGAMGIRVCDDWNIRFRPFESWALSHGYKPGLSIDRINPDGDYCPENCQFITIQENVSKRRRRTKYEISIGAPFKKAGPEKKPLPDDHAVPMGPVPAERRRQERQMAFIAEG
jgi:hypothetical protein